MSNAMVKTTAWVAAISLMSAAASAHHSAAMFDMQKEVVVNGVVKDFQYTNPHAWLIVMTRGADDKDTEWSFETEGPSTLERAGIKRSSLQAGDKVSVKTHPMKDGRTAGLWLVVTKSDGTVLQPRGAPPPGGKPPG